MEAAPTKERTMNRKTSLRLIKPLGIGIAVMAIAAPAAQAMPEVQSPNDPHASAPIAQNAAYPDLVRAVPSGPTDSLGRPLPAEPTDSLGRPVGDGIVQPTSDVSSGNSMSDWTYVGIGLFAIGLMLLAGCALVISRQN